MDHPQPCSGVVHGLFRDVQEFFRVDEGLFGGRSGVVHGQFRDGSGVVQG